ncbi:MAG: hypothetical protein H8D23_10960, partial [Candidatus Brocadiales bacterium]|nr:hypothetical protein [Candidatus Brocadiales bacterium]
MIRQIGPALAYKPNKVEIVHNILSNKKDTWVYQHKFDGSRYLAHIVDNKVTLTSRRISSVTEKYAEYELEHLQFFHDDLNDTVIDGELMSTSAASLTAGEYIVFDILFYKGQDLTALPYKERIKYVHKVVEKIKHKFPDIPVKEAEVMEITDGNLVREHFKQYLAGGGEGFVLKNLESPYLINSRSRNMIIKWKREHTYDVIIQGFEKSDSDKYGPKGLDTFRHLYGYQYDAGGNLVLVSNIPATSWTDAAHRDLRAAGLTNLDGKIAEVGAMER